MNWSKLLLGCVAIGALAGCDKPKWAQSSAPAASSSPAQVAAAPAPAPPPVPTTQDPLPAYPAWAAQMIGQPVDKVLTGAADCVGNLDVATKRYVGANGGTKVIGWAWAVKQGKIVNHIVLVDQTAKIVGAGEGGLPRPDVPENSATVKSPNTGWQAFTSLTKGPVDAFGIVEGLGRCPLGHIEL